MISDEPWQTCYREVAPRLLIFARQWLPCFADAQDVVQTAFVKFWRHRPDAGREHYPLLYAAVRSTALDFLRGQDRRLRREADPAVDVASEDTPFFDGAVARNDDAQFVEDGCADFPPSSAKCSYYESGASSLSLKSPRRSANQ